MKNFIVIITLLCLSVSICAQNETSNLKAVSKNDFGPIVKRQEFVIKGVSLETITYQNGALFNASSDNIFTRDLVRSMEVNEPHYCLHVNGLKVPLLSESVVKNMAFLPENIQDLWDAQIISKVLFKLKDRGMQYDLRSEMESEAKDFIHKIKDYELEFEDPYLESYIYSLIAKLVPRNIIDGRPGSINIVMVKDPMMNVRMYPNGSILISTGTLSQIHSEAELVALLGHEISHFMLDHSIQNVNKINDRKKRAEFWKGLAVGLSAVAEMVATTKNRYYVPGGTTTAVAYATYALTDEIVDRLGVKYTHEQDSEADYVACEMLKVLGYDYNALATVYGRIAQAQKQDRSSETYFDSYDAPELMKRIQFCGTQNDQNKDSSFEKYVSFAVTNTAILKYEDGRFWQSLDLVNQNIKNGVATSSDYLIKANCLMALFNDVSRNTEAQKLISNARELAPSDFGVCKADIIINIRLGNKDIAISRLNDYISMVTNLESTANKELLKLLSVELRWANDMISKIRGM